MTTIDETTKNGRAAPAGDKLPLVDLNLPTAPGESFEGLSAGDGDADTTGPVEQHLITVKPEGRRRLAVLDRG